MARVTGTTTHGEIAASPVAVSAWRRAELANALRAARGGTAWRREPVDRKAAFARRAGVDVSAAAGVEVVDTALERIMANPDFLPGSWLQRGSQATDAVALIERADRDTATGFLVTPWLLLTNRHVFPTADAAAGAVLRFRYQLDADSQLTRVREHDADPERCFLAGQADGLDYALVAVAPRPGDGDKPPGRTCRPVPMIGSTGKALLGQPVNIVQHPRGRPREIVVRNNLLLTLTEHVLTYAADTESGSSGAPIFNDRWELIGLHRRAVEDRNDAGEPIDINGRPVTRATPEAQRSWVANEGIRTSAIVADLKARTLSEAQRLLVTDIGG